MQLKPWQAVFLPIAVSFALTALAVPRADLLSNATLSLAAGVAALALMAIAAISGARWHWVESLFGGLDRMYQAHKWMGVWALGLASYHLIFRAGLRTWEVAPILPLAGDVTRFVRQASFVALMFIVLLALNRNIPYSVWRGWHKLSGPLFLVVLLHWLSIRSPIALYSPAGIWLALVSVAGVAAAAYKLLLYPFLAPHAEYEVAGVASGGSAVHLSLVPVGRGLPFSAGQFGFLVLKQDGLREPHPFTIATAGQDGGRIDFLIRGLGDYTNRLVREARPGMRADVYAPYGRFVRSRDAKREIWIGGGVGISPFVAWLDDAAAGGFEDVVLFYYYTPGRAFPEPEIVERIARERGASFVPMAGLPAGNALKDTLARAASEVGPEHVDVSVCGPKGLLGYVRELVDETGIPQSRLRHEYFEFR